MRAATGGRLFTIPPGAAFLKTLASALCEERLVSGFRFDANDPAALSRATIFVPTRRAARVLRSEFVDHLGGRSAILPVIRPLGEIDEDAGFFDAAIPAALDLDRPVGKVARLIELARLIFAWKQHLPRAVSDVHAGNPLIAPANPADAVWLARGLADLLEAMETEECDWSALDRLDTADHAAWWQLTLEFLKIATVFWPARLSEMNRSSPAAHRNALLRAEAQRLKSGLPRGPVIVAGSTGSLPATAELIDAVIDLDQGAVVLPGLDRIMEESHWTMLAGSAAVEDPAISAHPQYGLCRLLEKLGRQRGDAEELAAADPEMAARNRLVSLAMLPAAATDMWARQETVARSDIASGLEKVSLVEAANERTEAQALAVAIRLALETDDVHGQVALVTPDRGLARRVAIELRRFGIEADDSAGTPLGATQPGTLLSLAVEVAVQPGDPIALLALVKHPLARFGLPAGEMARAAGILEMTALRGGTGEADAATLATLLAERLAADEDDHHKPVWRSRITDGEIALAHDLSVRIEAAVKPLADRLLRRREPPDAGMTGGFPVASWARDTALVLEAIARNGTGDCAGLWGGEAGEALAELLSGVIECEAELTVREAEWAAMLPALLAGETVKPRAGGHPRVFIWGALEARLQHVDTIVLAGLNEGSWPGGTTDDPFLSRGMKAAIGLEPPERRIGQAAHDFQMALGANRVVLSRSARAGNGPTVASRWLQRLLAVAGEEVAGAMRARGDAWIGWSETLDTGESLPPARRPEPRPPREMQPVQYSFSEVKTLRRDPYAIYARRILRLDPLAQTLGDPSVAERGSLYHAVLEAFTLSGLAADDPRALDRLREIADQLFAAEKLPAHIAAIWRPRFDRVGELFLDWERGRDAEIRTRHVEARARLMLSSGDVALSGKADRIDVGVDGSAEIIDYKTGTSPSAKQARTLLDPQLALEAGVLKAGGFRKLPATPVSHLSYVRLRPGGSLKVERVDNWKPDRPDTRTADELADEALRQFAGFVAHLASGKRGFASRLIPASARDFGGEYDHLARVAEWSTADDEEANGDE